MEKSAFAINPPFCNNYSKEFHIWKSGEGCYLEDVDGKKFLDFGSGIAVNSLGYGRKDLAKVMASQAEKLIHVSNLYTTEPTLALAKKLTSLGDFEAVHFGNSGSEANEAALKYSRIFAKRVKGDGVYKYLSFSSAFHGRTAGALSVTPNEKYHKPYSPLLEDCVVCEFNNVENLKEVLDESFAAVIVEPIQGEGGLTKASEEFCQTLNSLCKKFNVILIADEIQTGLGRTGYTFASELVGLEPDIITLAKPLAGGLPLSATLIPQKINSLIEVGDHGTTFGGGPVTCAVSNYVLDEILNPTFLESVVKKGEYLKEKLAELKDEFSFIKELKGFGLMQGFSLDSINPSDIVKLAEENGLLLLRSGKDVVRILPPLVIKEEDIDEGINILKKILKNIGV